MNKKTVYIGMSADILHHGHLNIINQGKKLGNVIVGLLTDEAISTYKRLPLITFENRKRIIENIKGVEQVIPQETLDYAPNLYKIKPDYVVHGSDWKTGVQKNTRDQVIKTLSEWGGELIEPDYTDGISSTQIINNIKEKGVTPNQRLGTLKRLLNTKSVSKLLEAHSGLTGLIAEKTNYDNNQFDGMWISSLTVSTTKGKPDTEIIDFSSRFQTIEEILEVTTKPIVVDGDTGGKIEHFKFTVRTLERLGISAVIIEDKIGNKRNSLFGNSVKQEQDTIQHFCKKIEVGKNALITDDFMIIARIESLIMKKGYQDAIDRAKAYIDAGADGIMIHSKDNNTKELQSFYDIYNKFQNRKPLILVPTAYSQYTELELNKKFGANLIIYANQLLRSAYPSMAKVAESILKYSRSEEASKKYCMSIKDIITLIPEDY
ncbi:MAG: phosphoenolpyruvate mutase [Candidatus Marinimicrobia bacterium]|nr:phosphoenolpyruvate mutase [Candidatus Neomarinimicrobiota bacterium]